MNIKPILAGVLLFLIAFGLALLVFFFGAKAGFATPSEKITVWASLTVVLATLFFLPVIVRALWLGWSVRFANRSLKPEEMADQNAESTRLVGAAYRWEQLRQVYQLAGQYKDHHKPWILVIGDDELLERTFPSIKENLWIESDEAFWLDAQGIEPVGGWDMLRGNGKCPAEGIICLVNESNQARSFSEQLNTLFAKLNWTLPVNCVCVYSNDNDSGDSVVTHVLGNNNSKEKLDLSLSLFIQELKVLGTAAIEQDTNYRFIASLSKKLETDSSSLVEAIATDKKALGKLDTIGRISFVASNHIEAFHQLVFKSFDGVNVFGRGKKLKCSQSDKVVWGLSLLALVFVGVFAYAAAHSQQDMMRFQSNLGQMNQGESELSPDSFKKLLILQNEISSLEKDKTGVGRSVARLVGYDYSDLLLEEAYKQYSDFAHETILQPTYKQLVGHLNELNSLSDRELSALSDKGTEYYNLLKAYLMLTDRTDKMDPAFLEKYVKQTILQTVPQVQASYTQEVVTFFIQQFSKNKNWAAPADTALLEQSRRSLSLWMGEHQTVDRVYSRIIDFAKEKYPTVTLAQLLNRDLRGIWTVGKSLPGIYTLRGWEEYIKPEFEKAAKNNRGDDWVIEHGVQQESMNEAMITGLKGRYFNEYAGAWFNVLNSITWVSRTKTADTVGQLHTYADPQRSPLVGLFNLIKANGMLEGKQVVLNSAIVRNQAEKLIENQVSKKAKQAADVILESQDGQVAEVQGQITKYIEGPLQDKFETLLQLVDANINPKSDLSLQRYLEKITSTKQKLIQLSGASDPGSAARIAMQSVVKGEDNQFSDGLEYARLIEASVGDGWLPFSHNVFVLPLRTSLDSIAGSARQNINVMWNQGLSESFKSDLGGRYPFSLSETEVSIPMLAKYLEPEKGSIDQFIKTQLGGIVTKQGNQWVEVPGLDLKVNKNFIKQVNKISTVANDFFINGEAGYMFELKPAATYGIARFNLSLDGQAMEYFNQEAEWKSFKWPGDMANAGVRVIWESDEAGLRQTREYNGRLGFIRMLEAARVTPVDGSTYLIESPVSGGKSLRFYMRTNAGKGPLGLLDLRNIQLPMQIFEAK